MSDRRRRKVAGTPRCRALIRKRDIYRYTGRSKSGFEMHYRDEQCHRIAVANNHCREHDHPWTLDCSWAEPEFATLEGDPPPATSREG